ncbi:MAG: cytochrome c biogenesis protein ResB [Desulfosarcinaceae bacterium]|nr:cytochrome c biogenesis protein ResB [Desulfosarcinaceae bacterium]
MRSNTKQLPGFFDGLWQFFASVKLTVVVLLALALTSIIGTLIPQNQPLEEYYQAFGDFLFRVFAVLDLYNMYNAWWFQLLLALLILNIIVCSIDRLSSLSKIVFVRHPRFSLKRFRKAKPNHSFRAPGDADTLLETYQAVVKRHFRYQRVETVDGATCIYAEKGRWTRLGVYVVHFSIVLLIIGAMIGSLFGFEGFVNIPEGEGTDTIRMRNNPALGMRLPFEIHCDDFHMETWPNGAPKLFRSSLRLVQNGKTIYQKDIVMNDPIRFQGINVFQSSYGELPPDRRAQTGADNDRVPESFDLQLTSADSGMTYTKTARIGDAIDLPEGLGSFTVEEYVPDMQFGGQDLGPALRGRLNPATGEAREVTLPLRFPNFDKMRQGKVVIAVANTPNERFTPPSPTEKRYYTGLQVTRDPGVSVVYLAFIMMIAGCAITFFMSHRQIYVELGAAGQVRVAGIANKNPLGLERHIERLADHLAAATEDG